MKFNSPSSCVKPERSLKITHANIFKNRQDVQLNCIKSHTQELYNRILDREEPPNLSAAAAASTLITKRKLVLVLRGQGRLREVQSAVWGVRTTKEINTTLVLWDTRILRIQSV